LSSEDSGIRYESAKGGCICASLTVNLKGVPRRHRSRRNVTEQNESGDEPKRIDWKKLMREAVKEATAKRTPKAMRRLTGAKTLKGLMKAPPPTEEQEIEEMMLASLEAVKMGLMEPLYRPTLAEIFATKSQGNTRSPSNPTK